MTLNRRPISWSCLFPFQWFQALQVFDPEECVGPVGRSDAYIIIGNQTGEEFRSRFAAGAEKSRQFECENQFMRSHCADLDWYCIVTRSERKKGRGESEWVCGSCESHRVANWTLKVSHGNWDTRSVGFNLVALRAVVSLSFFSSYRIHPRRRCGLRTDSFLRDDCVQWLWTLCVSLSHLPDRTISTQNLIETDEMWTDLKH